LTGPRILVTGAGGFVGTSVVAALGDGPPPRLMAHRRAVNGPPRPEAVNGPPRPEAVNGPPRPEAVNRPPRAEVVSADVTNAASLRGCCDGIDVVVHLASTVSRDEARCMAVNLHGTGNLLDEAARAGVRDVIYVSTAAVHGRGPHDDLAESSQPTPLSAASRSRHLAEKAVLAAGGVVLRPFFTYGDGDRWFVPTLLRWLRTRVWLDGGNSRQSVVAVDDLAAVVAAAARRPAAFAGSPFHVCEPRPVRTSEMLLALARIYRLPRPRFSVPASATLNVLHRCHLFRLERRLELFGVDHTYQSRRAWQAAGREPGPAMLDRLDRYATWYERFIESGRGQGGPR
jgi:nucleoside-diphosphate-sugar epimerase